MPDKHPALSLGGGGASAPSTVNDPLIAPGVHRPDWPTPEYAKLPWQRKLEWTGRYAVRLKENGYRESVPQWNQAIALLYDFKEGKTDEIPVDQMTAALDLIAQTCSYPEHFIACAVGDAPQRGQTTIDAFKAGLILEKLSRVAA